MMLLRVLKKMTHKILVFGGSGRLGSEILKLNSKVISPRRNDLNIGDIVSIESFFIDNHIDLVINCAAITDTVFCEKNIHDTIKINTCGPANLVMLQEKYNFKLAHISTDYVFDGKSGNYKPSDPINPISNYSKSKAAAELIVRMNPKNLVIRTSFFPLEFKHPAAFVDQYTTKDFVDIIAPMVYEAAISDKTGVVHIGTEKDSVYNKVKKRYPNIKKMSRKDIKSVYIPYDTSLE